MTSTAKANFYKTAVSDVSSRRIMLIWLVCCVLLSSSGRAWAQSSPTRRRSDQQYISLLADEKAKSVKVLCGETPFAVFKYGDQAKPFLHPVNGPDGLRMTRDFPMKATKGEANDHSHHKSIWIGHEVNGLDFWTNKDGNIQISQPPAVDENNCSLTASSKWVSHEGQIICRDQTRWTFAADDLSRWIDCEFVLVASEGNITINDTKEGTVAIRTHPDLRLKPDRKHGVEKVFGAAMNSNGTSGPSIWGQSAAWVAYTGKIDSKSASIVLFDHPSNFRHPTTWHARDYGLVAANPFGFAAFQGTKKGTGAVTLAKGQRLTLRYRFQFFAKEVSTEDCDVAWQAFANSDVQK